MSKVCLLANYLCAKGSNLSGTMETAQRCKPTDHKKTKNRLVCCSFSSCSVSDSDNAVFAIRFSLKRIETLLLLDAFVPINGIH